MRIGELCAGYGGLGMGVQSVLGGELAWVSEYEPPSKGNPNPKQGAARILAHRFPGVPNLGDMTTVDWSTVEPVDVLTGGTPCQDLSHAGKRAGMAEGTRSNLWVSMREAIATLRPSLVVWENVRGAYSAPADSDLESREGRLGVRGDGPVLRALGRVLGDLSSLGFDAEWVGIRAADVGAPHGRFRIFVTAWDATGTARRGPKFGDLRARPVAAAEPRESASAPAPHAADDGRERRRPSRHGRDGSTDHRDVAADSEGQRRGEGRAEPTRLVRGSNDVVGGASVEWGQYEPAIRRWERCLGRLAPSPTEPGKNGPRLSAHFVEWMQGLPVGWVTDVPGLTRNEQLKALGNGVVPQQAAAALRLLLPDATEAAA